MSRASGNNRAPHKWLLLERGKRKLGPLELYQMLVIEVEPSGLRVRREDQPEWTSWENRREKYPELGKIELRPSQAAASPSQADSRAIGRRFLCPTCQNQFQVFHVVLPDNIACPSCSLMFRATDNIVYNEQRCREGSPPIAGKGHRVSNKPNDGTRSIIVSLFWMVVLDGKARFWVVGVGLGLVLCLLDNSPRSSSSRNTVIETPRSETESSTRVYFDSIGVKYTDDQIRDTARQIDKAWDESR